MNEYGKMVYIDSVYQHTNSLLDASRAQIRNEDSTYVALIPRDAAWKEALEKVSKIYNYGTRYRSIGTVPTSPKNIVWMPLPLLIRA